jgi:NTE family protein
LREPVPAGAAGVLAVVAMCASACAHYPETAALPANVASPAPARYAFDALAAAEAEDDVFVCLAFSGGGTRAASLAYGVLEVLRDTRIVRPKDGKVESLLDEVDCISSVSGGSFASAYFGLFGHGIFRDFRSAFLHRNIQGDLAWRVANPYNWFRLWSPYFSRIDVASELYHQTIFGQKTYGDLLAAGRRPFLILNGTDLATGDVFAFTQEQFDLIGSDLAAFPLARAVAASSAFPFLLTPISLTNRPAPAWYRPPRPIANGARDYYVNRRRFSFLGHQTGYLDKAANPYVHVMDGGLADNIGVRAILREWWEPSGFIAQRLNRGKTSRFVVIAVNAKAGAPEQMGRRESPPGLAKVAFKTATVAMDNYTFESIEVLRDFKRQNTQAQKVFARCKEIAREEGDCPNLAAPYEIHVVDVSLDAIADPARRQQLLNIGTNFSLSRHEVDLVIAAAHELLDQNPDFKALTKSLQPSQ